MADTFASFSHKIGVLRDELDGTALQRKLDHIGIAAKKDALNALKSDIGDTSMSNWRRKRQIKIGVRYDFLSESEIEVKPTPRSLGPWTVLEQGRRAGRSKPKRRSPRGRYYSASKGKKTWSEAVKIMERETPKRVDRYVVKAAIRKAGV
jgi:hypothetical protein